MLKGKSLLLQNVYATDFENKIRNIEINATHFGYYEVYGIKKKKEQLETARFAWKIANNTYLVKRVEEDGFFNDAYNWKDRPYWAGQHPFDQEHQRAINYFNKYLKKKLPEVFIPIMIQAYKRPDYLNKTLETIYLAEKINETMIVISQDGNFSQVTKIIQSYYSKLNILHIRYPREPIPKPLLGYQNDTMIKEYYCSRSYHWMITLAKYMNFTAIITTDDDINFSHDFYTFSLYVNRNLFQNVFWAKKIGMMLLMTSKRKMDSIEDLFTFYFSGSPDRAVLIPQYILRDYMYPSSYRHFRTDI